MIFQRREIAGAIQSIRMHGSLQAVGFAAAITCGLAALAGAFSPQSLASASPTQIRVESLPPKAEVWLDGTAQGVSPVTLNAVPGPHKLELRKAGFEPAECPVTVIQGESTTVLKRLACKAARLTLRESDQAEIQIGPGIPQSLKGKGPWKIEPGFYEVTARRGAVMAEPKKFEAKPGQDLRLTLVWPHPPAPVERPPVSAPSPAAPRPAPPRPVYSPPRPVYHRPVQPYQPPVRLYTPPAPPQALFTPIAPSRPETVPYHPPGPDEPLFTPLP